MIRRWSRKPAPADAELEEARKRVASSRAQAAKDLRRSALAAVEARRLADVLRSHNDANGYADWVEQNVLGGGTS